MRDFQMIKISMPTNEELIQELESEVALLEKILNEAMRALEFPIKEKERFGKYPVMARERDDLITHVNKILKLNRETLKKIQELREE